MVGNFAANTYSVTLYCGHDKAWKDIPGKGDDQYGRPRLRESFAELFLSRDSLTEI